jgi:hypothetical protein
MSQADMSINFNDFNHNDEIIRNIDLLTNQLGGKLTIQTAMRAVYMSVMESSKSRKSTISNQDFSITRKEKKYSRVSSLLNTKRSLFSFTDLSQVKELDLISKKVLISSLTKDLNLSKQLKWG